MFRKQHVSAVQWLTKHIRLTISLNMTRMSSLLTDLQKNVWNNVLDKLLIPFNILGITAKVTIENFNALSHVCKIICFGIYQAQVTMVLNDVSVTFIDITDPSDPLKKHLGLWRPMGLILKIVSEFYQYLIKLKLALFILPIYCIWWIIGTTCFSGFELWKINYL